MTQADPQKQKANVAELSASRAWWLATTAIAAALILGIGTLLVVRLIALPLAVFIFGLSLAAALNPMIAWLEARLPRLAAIVLVYLMIALLFGGLLWMVVPAMGSQIQDLGSRVPELAERVRDLINRSSGDAAGDSFTSALVSQLSDLGPTLLRLPLTISSVIFRILLIVFLSFYILLEASRMQAFFLSLFPDERRARVRNVVHSMAQSMGGYIRGTVINGLIVGFLTFFGLLLLGVDFALAFGVMAGVLELLPVVGPIIAGLIIVGLTLLQSPWQALAVLAFMLVLQQVENNILVPHIMRSQTDASPLLSILALFTGGAIGGLMGALVAIPIAAALRVLVSQVVAPAIRSETNGQPLEEPVE